MKLLFNLLLFHLFFATVIHSQSTNQLILIDFGYNYTTEPGWNNVDNPYVGAPYSLIDSEGSETGYTLEVTDNFSDINGSGASANSSLNIPPTGSSDSFYGNDIEFYGATEPTGEVVISNLDTAIAYSFTFFASRSDVTDNRETKYTVIGKSLESGNLNVSNNTQETVNIADIYPATDGTIRLKAEKGDNNNNYFGFFYLGIVKITYGIPEHPNNPSIDLNFPNGGEAFESGDEVSITWNTANISFIDIDYSTNNGTDWITAGNAVPASNGIYSWITPSVDSENCLIRISDASNNSNNDISDASFSISTPADTVLNTVVNLISPNGGEEYVAGNTYSISWSSTNIDNVQISYSLDNGINWSTIINSAPAGNGAYNWTAPAENSNNCLVRISDVSNPSINDISDAIFDINTPVDKVVQIDFGYNYTTEPGWNNVENPYVGAPYSLIDSEGSETGYTLEVTDNFSDINGSGASANSSLNIPPTGSSDSFYGNDIEFYGATEPTGEVVISNLDAAIAYSFTFFASRSDVTDNRETKYTVIGKSLESGNLNVSNNTQETVNIADIYPATDGTIRLKAEKGDNNNNYFGFFYLGIVKITYGIPEHPNNPSIDLNFPNGGEAFESGDEVSITWNTANISFIDIDYSTNNGTDWITAGNAVPASNGIYSWITPSVDSENCLIRISDASNNSNNDISDASFSISTPADTVLNTVVNLISPNGGEEYVAGNTYSISWSSTNIDNVQISYSLDNGINWSTIINSAPAGNGAYNWTAPAENSNNCLVRISDVSNPSINDISDAIFDINTPVDKVVQIDFGYNYTTEPGWNNVENPYVGAPYSLIDSEGSETGYTLEVTDNFSDINGSGASANSSLNIPPTGSSDSFYGNDIEFYGATEPTGEVVISNLDAAIAYSFTFFASRSDVTDNRETKYTVIGKSLESGNLNVSNNTQETVNIADIYPATDGTIRLKAEKGDNNNNYFGFFYLGIVKITYGIPEHPNNPSIDLNFPNGGETFSSSNQIQIRWTSFNVSNVDIEYSLNNGTNWTEIITSYPATNGYYDWTIPNDPSVNCLIKITDSSNDVVVDQCNNNFSIISNKQFHIVVLGSSTAEGNGATPRDSAWVWRYKNYLSQTSPGSNITNLAYGGFTTYDILPSGVSSNNISMAMSLNPDAIIINLPSNDALNYIPVSEQLANFQAIVNIANAGGVPVWITTTQPRNFGNDAYRYQIQFDMIDSIKSIYGEFAIDFWTPIATSEGLILEQYYFDDAHVNNAGHYQLFLQVINKNIVDYLTNNSTNTLKNSITIDNSNSLKESYNSTLLSNNNKTRNIQNSLITDIYNNINIFPNPVTNELRFNINNDHVIQDITIYNFSGAEIIKQKINKHQGSVDFSIFPVGFYLLQIRIENENYNFTIIKNSN